LKTDNFKTQPLQNQNKVSLLKEVQARGGCVSYFSTLMKHTSTLPASSR